MTKKISTIISTMDYGLAPENTEHVQEWLFSHKNSFSHYINGEFITNNNDNKISVYNPSTNLELGKILLGNASDVNLAVKAAKSALPIWSATSPHQRAKYLYAIARNLQKKQRFLSVLESLDSGKPIRESRDIDIPLVIRHFYHHAGWAEIIKTEFPNFMPIGVCGQIVPWNFPLLMMSWKIAPALASGNTVVIKPAEFTPFTAIAFAEICIEVGLPKGVVNIVTGDGETGSYIVKHDDVNKIAFTGSTAVGKIIRKETAGTKKSLTLELGGKSPFIVFADADIDASIEGVVDATWYNQGQVCCSGARILVQESICEIFKAKLSSRMNKLRIGNPLDKSTDIGSIINKKQLKRITDLVEIGQQEGAILNTINNHNIDALPGNYFSPCFFTDVYPSSTLFNEEIFGPVATITSFRTNSEAIELANNTKYGLSASIWSENISLSLDIANQVKAGVVWLNSTNIFDAGAGFGGFRQSGYGREGAREGLHEYLTTSFFTKKSEAKINKLNVASCNTSNSQESIDHTYKLFIGGEEKRPDSGYSYSVLNSNNNLLGYASLGNKKDIRNAVESSIKALKWGKATGHNRAQILYYLAENLSLREKEFIEKIVKYSCVSTSEAKKEFTDSVQKCFWYAGQADKFDGIVHQTKSKYITLAVNEPFGVIGLACPEEKPLLSFLSLVLPIITMGNSVVAIPSQNQPLIISDLHQVIKNSDFPSGVINIITGDKDELIKVLAEHDDVSCVWYFGSKQGSKVVQEASVGNIKYTWVNHGYLCDWSDNKLGREFLRKACQIKNIWLPYGE